MKIARGNGDVDLIARKEEEGIVAVTMWEKFSQYSYSVQGVGLICITGLSFFPRWFHTAEYLFVGLIVVGLCTAWAKKTLKWISTPIDVPLLVFSSWVLVTIPFAVDSEYSLLEWRKFVVQVVLFYWSTSVLAAGGGKRWFRGMMWVIV